MQQLYKCAKSPYIYSQFAMALVYLTRRETFSACHRLHCSDLTPEENRWGDPVITRQKKEKNI